MTFTTAPAVRSPPCTSLSGCGGGGGGGGGSGYVDQHQQQSTERTQHHGSRNSIPAGHVGEGRTGGDARAGSYPHAPWTLDYALRGTGEESVAGEARARLGTMREGSIVATQPPPGRRQHRSAGATGCSSRQPRPTSTPTSRDSLLVLQFRHKGLFRQLSSQYTRIGSCNEIHSFRPQKICSFSLGGRTLFSPKINQST